MDADWLMKEPLIHTNLKYLTNEGIYVKPQDLPP